MRKFIFHVLVLLLLILLSGCSGIPTDQDNSNNGSDDALGNAPVGMEDEQQDNEQNTNFNQFVDAPEDAIALIINLPTPEQMLLLNVSETLSLQETNEQIILIPRYEHTGIEVYSVEGNGDEETLSFNSIYSNADCQKDFSIEIKAFRPEGIPKYKIGISLPDGTEKEYFISYDGMNGNPNIEYVLK